MKSDPRTFGMTEGAYCEALATAGAKPLREFRAQRYMAARRGIGWELTFAQWWQIWQESGKYPQRGPSGHQYVMARKWDRGPYAEGNVEIQTAHENMETVRLRRQFRRCRGPRKVALIDRDDFTESLDEAN